MNDPNDPDTTGFSLPTNPEPQARPEVVAADTVPRQVGRYRVEGLLGEASFGRVFLAHDDELHRPVAIKVPHRRLVSCREDAEAYLTEARTVAGLDHPHIVPVYDVGSTEDIPCFVVSKFIEGSDLKRKIGEGRPPFHESAALVATVAEALHYAHLKGVVHRDIKPGNILLDAAGKPHLADFGLALREEDFGKAAAFAGSPAYMSPEQARGEGHRVDGRSDVFSLGVILYELLTGRRPFRADSVAELLQQIAGLEARPPRQIDDRIPKELERICLKALRKQPSDRYTTAKDVADDLWQFLAQQTGDEPCGPGGKARRSPPPIPAAPDTDRVSAKGMAEPIVEGMRLGDYEIVGELGRGGMGVVYKAIDPHGRRAVAVKAVLSRMHASEESLARFRKEARIAGQLHHPNIVEVYEVGEHEGCPFLVMEYMEGVGLDRSLRGRPLNVERAAGMVEVLARAVHCIHQSGYLHGDLKPSSVLFTADGTPKIADFGVAMKLQGTRVEPGQIPGEGSILGTPSYMAPEQARGDFRALGPATDIFSLGAMLYELLTGRPPFRGPTLIESLDLLRSGEVVSPRALQPGVPEDVEFICLKCLQLQPQQRYASADALADDLRRFLAGEPIPGRPLGFWNHALRWATRLLRKPKV